jgi:hypothetical protein
MYFRKPCATAGRCFHLRCLTYQHFFFGSSLHREQSTISPAFHVLPETLRYRMAMFPSPLFDMVRRPFLLFPLFNPFPTVDRCVQRPLVPLATMNQPLIQPF